MDKSRIKKHPDGVVELFADEAAKSKAAVIDEIELLLEKARAGEIESLVLCAKLADGDTATGWVNCGVGLRQELISTLQVDLMYKVVCMNLLEL